MGGKGRREVRGERTGREGKTRGREGGRVEGRGEGRVGEGRERDKGGGV